MYSGKRPNVDFGQSDHIQMIPGQIQDLQIWHVFEEARLDEVNLVGVELQMVKAGVVRQSLLTQILHLVTREVQHVHGMRKFGWDALEAQTAAEHVHLDLRIETNTGLMISACCQPP